MTESTDAVKTEMVRVTENIAEGALSGAIEAAVFITTGKNGLEVTPVNMKCNAAVGSCQIAITILMQRMLAR